MQYLEFMLLSSSLMLAIFADVLRFPLLRKGRGSRFFGGISIVYSVFLILSMVVTGVEESFLTFPVYVERVLWALQFLSFPFLLAMWMHFNALNVIDNPKLVSRLTYIHLIPLVGLTVLTVADISLQKFYPLNAAYAHMLPVAGTTFMMVVSVFFCLGMLLPTLAHAKELQGSFLFISILLPTTLLISMVTFWITHSYALFIVVNPFMLVLYYLIGQRDSVILDGLTGLPTMALLERKLIRIFRFQVSSSVILLDIENFHAFNARHGQRIGDSLLVKLAEYLGSLCIANELFRLDSDRFCLCIPNREGSLADRLVTQIQERMDQPWEVEGMFLYIQVNIAVISIPKQASTLDEFKRATDQLLLEIKSVRNTGKIVYTRALSLDKQHKQDIISALRDSIRDPNQVQVYYQPVYEIGTGKLISAEALMRIVDKHLGFLLPDDFIPLAEQTGLIVQLTQILLTKVCQMMKRISQEQNSVEYIAVNLSGIEFESKAIGKNLLETIKREGVDPRRIGFEITESVVLQSYEMVASVMKELAGEGIFFALDDFGSGYSHLRALIDLPYAYVKFDKSVIRSSTTNPKMLTLLAGMLHTLDKCVIVEGVETEEELALAHKIGIERVQGFYFSEPLQGDEFMQLLRKAEKR